MRNEVHYSDLWGVALLAASLLWPVVPLVILLYLVWRLNGGF